MEFVYWRILEHDHHYYGWMDVDNVKEREADVYQWLNYRRYYHTREIGDKYERRPTHDADR